MLVFLGRLAEVKQQTFYIVYIRAPSDHQEVKKYVTLRPFLGHC